jgi:hypothetical protein
MTSPPSPPPRPTREAELADPETTEPAALVLAALKQRDMARLADLVDPDKGLRFSPYGYVEAKTDVVLSADQLRGAMNDPTVRRWGLFDGSGDPIDLTFTKYFARFVCDRDFTRGGKRPADFAENTVDNLRDVYGPRARVDRFYVAPPAGGSEFEWRELRLVFEARDGRWRLVGIAHSEWTI